MRKRRHSRGQSLVEFAVILPVFVLILFGIFDLGRAVFANTTVNNAAREGARHAIVDQTISDIQATAATSAVSLGIDPALVVVDLRNKSTPGTPDTCAAERPGENNNLTGMTQCIAVVTVEYDYSAATPVIGQLIGDITLTGESHFPVGFNCERPECPIGD
jgi:Flp pilus assembly protein TadG